MHIYKEGFVVNYYRFVTVCPTDMKDYTDTIDYTYKTITDMKPII